MVGMVGGLAQSENRRSGVTVDRLRDEDVPLRGEWKRIRVAGLIGAIPRDSHVAVGIGCHPGEHIRLSGLRCALGYFHGRGPTGSVSRRVGVINVGSVRPSGIDVAEVIYGDSGEQISQAESGTAFWTDSASDN